MTEMNGAPPSAFPYLCIMERLDIPAVQPWPPMHHATEDDEYDEYDEDEYAPLDPASPKHLGASRMTHVTASPSKTSKRINEITLGGNKTALGGNKTALGKSNTALGGSKIALAEYKIALITCRKPFVRCAPGL